MTKVKKIKKKTSFKINNFLILLCLISSIYLIYRILQLGPIEPVIRYIVIGIILVINFFFFQMKQKLKKEFAIFLMIVFVLFNVGISFLVGRVYDAIDSINKSKIVYSSSLVTLKENQIEEIDDVTGITIGLLNDTLSIDNYIIAKEIIEDYKLENDNKIVLYDDLLKMLGDLYHNKIDSMLISSNYAVMFSTTEGYNNIQDDLKEIITKDKTVAKNDTVSDATNHSTTKPFSILLMGVDSEKDGLKKNAYANGDALILITFNPYTLNTTMMSIPRDSYLPISCRNNQKNKLTHAGWYGTDCMMETIENTFGIDVNYYVKVNFKGVVNLVDALGGVNVEVPKKLCTDNSDRMGKICIDRGQQTLNGEQALVLARNRYDLVNGDIGRGYNQQLLVKAMLQKLTTVRSVDQLLEIIDTVSNNLDTNLTTNEILSFYNIFKNLMSANRYGDEIVNIEQIRLAGEGEMVYFKNLKMNLWSYMLDNNSIEKASQEMKINLEMESPTVIKEFAFSP
ncbi:MAG: LCP family protein [bacterium]|nr:LCP family protein [bacterium]